MNVRPTITEDQFVTLGSTALNMRQRIGVDLWDALWDETNLPEFLSSAPWAAEYLRRRGEASDAEAFTFGDVSNFAVWAPWSNGCCVKSQYRGGQADDTSLNAIYWDAQGHLNDRSLYQELTGNGYGAELHGDVILVSIN